MRVGYLLAAGLMMGGCTKFREQLCGVKEPGVKYVDRVVNVYELDGDVISDHFVVAGNKLDAAGVSVIVELCSTTGACLPLPFQNPVNGLTVTYLRQGALLSVYNAQTGLPNTPKYKVTVIDGLNR